MMEFTFQDAVRYGFGFYNPNHAAAFICALIPFCWEWKKYAAAGWLLSLLLAIPLALTYSRTGVLVLAFEFGAWLLLTRNAKWKTILFLLAAFAAVFYFSGVFSRFTLDRAVANRPEIWRAGLRLCAANPLGVGTGNSGMIVSAFLTEGIRCRTLVNSHLTLIAELGIFAGFLWFFLIFAALLLGTGKPRTWCAFAGMVFSAAAASVFDPGVLFDFRDAGGLSRLNQALSCAMFALFIGLAFRLVWKEKRAGAWCAAAGSAAALCTSFLLIDPRPAPEVRNGFVMVPGKEAPMVLYDREWNLETVLPYCRNGAMISVQPGMRIKSAATVWLFGAAAEYGGCFPASRIQLFHPPEFVEIPVNTEKIHR